MEKAIIKKMRLQLFDNEFNQLTDKLVAQDTEFYKGPEEPHKGPIKVEFCLFTQEDIEKCITYLNKITGNLPVDVKVRKIKKSTAGDEDPERDSIIEAVTSLDNQDAIIRYLRDKGFVFITTEQASDYELFEVDESIADFQWMVKLIKEAKDPANNKYDLTLKFGIKVVGEKVDKIIIYHFSESQEHTIAWKNPTKPTNYRKLNITQFPPYMVSNERLKFSKELAQYRRGKAESETPYTPPADSFTKSFKRWVPFVDFAEKEEILQIIQ